VREDDYTNTPEDAAEAARILGAHEHIGGGGDDGAGYDESRLCTVCERGHGGHVCAWCAGAVS